MDVKDYKVIDDTYNASPDSMKASVSVLSSMEGVKGRRIAALADMLELGEKEREYHYEVGKFIAGTQVDEVAAYGELSEEILKGVEDNNERIVVKHFESRDALKDYLLTYVHPDDVLLLKACQVLSLTESLPHQMTTRPPRRKKLRFCGLQAVPYVTLSHLYFYHPS